MPISFTCGQCSKPYVVSDGLAGKNAICKQCGNRMTVPGASSSAAGAPQAPRAVPVGRPVPSPGQSATARPRPSGDAVPKARLLSNPVTPPAEDIYGLNDAPSALPPLSPVARTGASDAGTPVKKKKKKGGFFGSGSKKSSSGGGSRGDGISGLRLIGLLVMVGSAVYGGIKGFGLSSKSEIETVLTRQLDLTEQLLNQLNGVVDAASARSMSPKLLDTIQQMTSNLEQNRHKKARMTDINAIGRRLKPRGEALTRQLTLTSQRIAMIPGASQALNIDGPLQRLAALEEELKREGEKDGVNVN